VKNVGRSKHGPEQRVSVNRKRYGCYRGASSGGREDCYIAPGLKVTIEPTPAPLFIFLDDGYGKKNPSGLINSAQFSSSRGLEYNAQIGIPHYLKKHPEKAIRDVEGFLCKDSSSYLQNDPVRVVPEGALSDGYHMIRTLFNKIAETMTRKYWRTIIIHSEALLNTGLYKITIYMNPKLRKKKKEKTPPSKDL
jgi:hypothetical protein